MCASYIKLPPLTIRKQMAVNIWREQHNLLSHLKFDFVFFDLVISVGTNQVMTNQLSNPWKKNHKLQIYFGKIGFPSNETQIMIELPFLFILNQTFTNQVLVDCVFSRVEPIFTSLPPVCPFLACHLSTSILPTLFPPYL